MGSGLTLIASAITIGVTLVVERLLWSGRLPPYSRIGQAVAAVFGFYLLVQLLDWAVGSIVWFVLLMIAALPVVFAPTVFAPRAENHAKVRKSRGLAVRDAIRSLPAFAATGALISGAVVAVAIVAAFCIVIPVGRADRALIAVLLLPLVWAGMSLYLFVAASRKVAYATSWGFAVCSFIYAVGVWFG